MNPEDNPALDWDKFARFSETEYYWGCVVGHGGYYEDYDTEIQDIICHNPFSMLDWDNDDLHLAMERIFNKSVVLDGERNT